MNSILVAVLGLVGAYATPVVLASGMDNIPGLLAYLLLLGVGVVSLCYWRDWPLVNYLSFAATYALFFMAMRSYQKAMFWQVFPLAVGIFVLFSTMTFLYKMVRRTPSNLLDVLAVVINGGVFAVVGFALVQERYDMRAAGLVSLGLAVFYTLHALEFARRRLVDRPLLISFMGAAALFLSLTMPMVLDASMVTSSWALQAIALLWVGQRLGSRFLQSLSTILFSVVLVRLLFNDVPNHFVLLRTATESMTERAYLLELVRRLISFGIPIGSFALASRMAGAVEPDPQSTAGRTAWLAQNDVEIAPVKEALRELLQIVTAILLCGYAHLEVGRTMGFFFEPARHVSLTLVWLVICGWLLFSARAQRSRLLAGLAIAVACLIVFKLMAIDLPSGVTDVSDLYNRPFPFRDAGLRLVDFAAVILFLGFLGRDRRREEFVVGMRKLAGGTSLVLLFFYLTLEVHSYLYRFHPGFRSAGVSVLWATYALGLLLPGITQDRWALRWTGLGLFAIVSLKTFLVDLSQTDPIWRIVGFVLLGLLLLAGSFLYLRYRERFATHSTAVDPKGGAIHG